MKKAVWTVAELKETGDLDYWFAKEFLAQMPTTLLKMPDAIHTEFQAVYNNSIKANQKLIETLDKVSTINSTIVDKNVYCDDRIAEFLAANHERLEPHEKLQSACNLIEDGEKAVKDCNMKAEECTDALKTNLYPTLEDINKRIAEICEFDENSIPAESFQDEKKKLQQLADDIEMGLLKASPKENEHFETYKKCLLVAVNEVENKLAYILRELNEVVDGASNVAIAGDDNATPVDDDASSISEDQGA